MGKRLTFLWFIMGLGTSLQIVASLSISELIVLISFPFFLFREAPYMRRNGVMPLFNLSLLVIVGCLVACWVNHTHPQFALRGLATCCLVSAVIVFSHWIIRRDPNGFKWYFLGAALSTIVCVFVFRRSTELSMYGDSVAEIMSGPLFWTERISAVALVPVKGWYLHVPTPISAFIPVALAAFSLLTSSSGRAAALASIGFAALVFIGGRRKKTMMRISRHFWFIIICAVVLIMILQSGYRISASQGWLGEKAQTKYELQTQGEKGIMRLLLGGRADAFIGLLAARDKPIIGWGPWAQDDSGYYRKEFLSKYGTLEDYEEFLKYERGGYLNMKLNLISCHSHITEFWVWFGISGLIFILYILFVLIRFLKDDVYAVPQWFAWLAGGLPSVVWHIFFSPFAHRVAFPMMIVACLMARAVRKGTFQLPFDMIKEVEEGECR